MAGMLSEDSRALLLRKGRHTAEELTPFAPEQLQAVEQVFAERSQSGSSRVALADMVRDNIDFSNVAFDEPFWAAGFIFPVQCDFSDAFLRWSNFSGAFFNRASFVGTSFSDEVNFADTSFAGWVGFAGAKFCNHAIFADATFSGHTLFARATFGSFTSFVNAEMKGETSFEAATFSSEPPRFFNATLHQGTVWRDVSLWPIPMRAGEAGQFVDAYACLKLEMDRLKKHDDEPDFFALELQSRRVLIGDWRPVSELKLFGHAIPTGSLRVPEMSLTLKPRELFGRSFRLPQFRIQARTITLCAPAFGLAIALYGLLCDYGRSFTRPFYGLLITAAAGALLCWVYWDMSQFGQAVGLSFPNTFGVLGVRKDLIDPHLIARLPGWLQVVAALQTGAGVVLLFLFGLAMRNRLRMR